MNNYRILAVTVALTAIVMANLVSAAVINITQGSTSGYKMTDGNTYVVQDSVSFSNSTAGGSGMSVADNATVVLYVPAGVTLTAIGANGNGRTGGGAGIRVPQTSTLIITGEGTINATGGNAGNGENGAKGSDGSASAIKTDNGDGAKGYTWAGSGGRGGNGGGGGGAALGGIGGTGGEFVTTPANSGSNGETMGTIFVIGCMNVIANIGQNGAPGNKGASGSAKVATVSIWDGNHSYYAGGGGGGGGGGAGAVPQFGIAGGGSSGGAGGSGSKGTTGSSDSGTHASVGATGQGGKSKVSNGIGGNGLSGGNAGAEGGSGTLYVSPTATVDVEREIMSATTHPAAQYTITLNTNGGQFSSSTESLIATLGCALPDCIAAPHKDRYVFVGWSTDPDGVAMWYDSDGNKLLSAYTITENTTLYAVWRLWVVEPPIITPTSGTIFDSSLTVSMSCPTEGAVIHYTTDGSEPTAESPEYRRFRITGKTTVKAVAVKDGMLSEVVTVVYGLGQCAVPVIDAVVSFSGSKTKVTLSCATEGVLIRYTLNGNAPTSRSAKYTVPFYVTKGCTIKAYATKEEYLDSAVATFTIEKIWGIGDTMGKPDHEFTTDDSGGKGWTRVDDATAPNGEAMKSGAITHNQSSVLSTKVMGPGTLSFSWRTSCEDDPQYEWDHAECAVDGTVVRWLCGVTEWESESVEIVGDGEHTIEWRYVKDDAESDGEDAAWVAGYGWTSDYTATQTTAVHVPYVWLLQLDPDIVDEFDAYEAAAKVIGENGYKLWESYMIGANPNDRNDILRITAFSMKADGTLDLDSVIVSPSRLQWNAQNATLALKGKMTLDDGEDWQPVTEENKAQFRFFKAEVVLP